MQQRLIVTLALVLACLAVRPVAAGTDVLEPAAEPSTVQQVYLPMLAADPGAVPVPPTPVPPMPWPPPVGFPAIALGVSRVMTAPDTLAVAVQIQNVSGAAVCDVYLGLQFIRADWSTFVLGVRSVDVHLEPDDRTMLAVATSTANDPRTRFQRIVAVSWQWCNSVSVEASAAKELTGG